MESITYLAPTGMLGVGFSEGYFRAALERDITFVACDSGSTDGGPAYLGAGHKFFSREAVKRDLRILLTGTRAKGIPLLIGSCGGSGANANLDWMADILREIAKEEDLHFRTALIYAEPEREALVEKYRNGGFAPLANAPEIDEFTLTDCEHIVAMMGPEPLLAALDGGADVVLAGRASDAALFAAIPAREGFPAGLCWHAAKIMECGGAAVAQMSKPEGMICTITADGFVLEPVSPEQSVTPTSVASHALYETADPYTMREPGGVMDLSQARYEAVDERRVKVTGSAFTEAAYSVKLEGAQLAGHRAMVLGGVSDPVLLEQLDEWLEGAKKSIAHNVDAVFGRPMSGEYDIQYRVYGRNGVMGERDSREPATGNEVGLLMVTLADTQDMAYTVAAQAAHMVHHRAVPEWQGLVSNLAFPISPHITPLGPAYRFALNHAVAVEDPMELFTTTFEEV
ncbi:acyclic terpene utilization AtuA family protein [Streptomyces sp. NPDC002577]